MDDENIAPTTISVIPMSPENGMILGRSHSWKRTTAPAIIIRIPTILLVRVGGMIRGSSMPRILPRIEISDKSRSRLESPFWTDKLKTGKRVRAAGFEPATEA